MSLLFLLVCDADVTCSCLGDSRLNHDHFQFQTIRPLDSNLTAFVVNGNRVLVMMDLAKLIKALSQVAQNLQHSLEEHSSPLLPQSKLRRGCLDAASALPGKVTLRCSHSLELI